MYLTVSFLICLNLYKQLSWVFFAPEFFLCHMHYKPNFFGFFPSNKKENKVVPNCFKIINSLETKWLTNNANLYSTLASPNSVINTNPSFSINIHALENLRSP